MFSAAGIDKLSYVELLANLSESNRPPGGIETVRRMVNATHLRPGLRVLHAGCNAGFLSRELFRRAGPDVIGIDISFPMVNAARSRAALELPDARLTYMPADMRSLPFPAGTFDVVLSGGALAFVRGRREAAIDEWIRVSRPHGLVADCELFYTRKPPATLLERLGNVLGVEVPVYTLDYWTALFSDARLERYYYHVETRPLAVDERLVLDYVDRMVAHTRLALLADGAERLKSRLLDIFKLFNENMSYLSYVILVNVVRPAGFEPALYV